MVSNNTKFLSTRLSVQAPVLNRFGNMLLVNVLTAAKVCNGTGDLEDAVVGAGRKPEPIGNQLQHAVAGSIQLAVLLDEAWCHLGIAVDLRPPVPFKLDLPRLLDPRRYCGRTLGVDPVGQFAVLDRGHLDVYVDAVQERPGYA